MISSGYSKALNTIVLTSCFVLMKVNPSEVSTITHVCLYTDLIPMIGNNDPCDMHSPSNDTSENGAFRAPVNKNAEFVLLTQYSFHSLQNSRDGCKRADILQTTFDNYFWVCSSRGVGLNLHMNWMFLDCDSLSVLSVDCISGSNMEEIINVVCRNATSGGERCLNYTTADDRVHVCSADFRVKRTYHNTVTNKEAEPHESPIWDILACVSGAFIIVSFCVAVCLPDDKCRPKYSYDKSKELRVPLEIYEMYGVSYQPSAKKKVRINIDSKELTAPNTLLRKGATVGNNNERKHLSRNVISEHEQVDSIKSENSTTGPSQLSAKDLIGILKNNQAPTNEYMFREPNESPEETCYVANKDHPKKDADNTGPDTHVREGTEGIGCTGPPCRYCVVNEGTEVIADTGPPCRYCVVDDGTEVIADTGPPCRYCVVDEGGVVIADTGPLCGSCVVDEINQNNFETDKEVDHRTSSVGNAQIVSRMLEKVIPCRRVSIV